ncbi:PREDICTED: uncharacterized protein LOC108758424 [Trachymyrmex cornetzi]|uniref:V-type proton ATPase subunit S1 n=1 Tax=Trachymyrmex cornetzi TaxID=471704 RepID=A0A195EEQ5_9HYME|nr:PREDICTED: uncharacterized protein LOC108758424 [Trachymyrmex cornetzi]KYN23329.1 V-type proton ATPase subunit S1 [Trachymyrmex cornetzi]
MTRGTGKTSNMVRVSFFALSLVCQLVFAYACTPTVIWCSHDSSDYDATYRKVPSSPLQRLTPDEFEKILLQLNVTEPAIVVEELCVEDLRNSKVLSNATNGSKIFYFACVVSSDEIIQKICKQKKMIEDINDDHNLNMILKDIDSNGCIVLTGKQCRYSYTERIKREVLADNSTSEFKIKTDDVLLYSAQPLTLKISDKPEVQLVQSKVTGMSSKNNNNTMILTIKLDDQTIGSLTLEFSFEIKRGYYTLTKVTYETINGVNTLSTKRDISFPFGFSYHCSPKTTFTDGTTFLNIMDMQVQVGHKGATFSDAYDCVGFTSIPIWTGIFVTVILGLIMIWALTMIMDIRTMDRFDDPKGKTITISSAE